MLGYGISDCLHCDKKVKLTGKLYCSNRCQVDYQYASYVEGWKRGEVTGSRGINAKNISKHVLRYLNEKYGNACSICGWSEINKFSGKVPLEIDHLVGNSDNNFEKNLRLLCPNCHSLTSSFRNLNKG